MNTSDRLNRRTFLKTTGAVGAGIVAGAPLLVYAQANPPLVRRDVRKLDPNGPEIKALRAGVKVMKDRPVSNATSWSFQANIHGLLAVPENALWAQCQHGQWWFFPWHRMYLYYFERILRKAIQESGTTLPDDFALPYWNYSDEDAARPLPDVFRARTYQPGAGAMSIPNPLFEADRRTDLNDPANPTPLRPHTVSYSLAFAQNQFVSSSTGSDGFGGQLVAAPVHQPQLAHGALEHSPHDLIHDAINGLMGDPDTAANDPIFWMHHCNIDRLWNQWLSQNPGANPDAASDWALQTFTFADENGALVTQPAYKFLEYVSGTLIDYKYDDAPAIAAALLPAPKAPALARAQPAAGHAVMESRPVSRPTRLASFPPQLHLTGKPLPVKISVPQPHQQLMARHLEGKAEPTEELLLEIGGIDFNTLPRGGYYEVYLNLPEGEAPSPKSKSYVGALSTFALREQAHAGRGHALKSGSFSFPLNRVVNQLKQGLSPSEMTVTFVPRELPPAENNDNPRLSFRYVGIQAAEKPVRPERKH